MEIRTLIVHADRARLREPPPRAEGIVAGSENLDSGRGKGPKSTIGFARIGGPQQERCLGLIELPGDLTHRLLIHSVGVRDDGKRIATKPLLGEDIDQIETQLVARTHMSLMLWRGKWDCTARSLLATVAAEDALGHRSDVHLIGAVIDAPGALVRPPERERRVVGEPARPQRLNGAIQHPLHRARNGELYDRDLFARLGRALLLDRPGGVQYQQTRAVDLRPTLRHPLLHQLAR